MAAEGSAPMETSEDEGGVHGRNRMGGADYHSDSASDSDSDSDWGTSRDSKLPRLEGQDNISSLARSHGNNDMDDEEEEDYEDEEEEFNELEEQRKMYPRRGERPLMEVYSARFLDFQRLDLDKIYGDIAIFTFAIPYVLFSRGKGDPPQIDPQGYIMLRGPNHSVCVLDNAEIQPLLVNKEVTETIFPTLLWCYGYTFKRFDTFRSEIAETEFGPLEVNYAVCSDGAEARVHVALTGWKEEREGDCGNDSDGDRDGDTGMDADSNAHGGGCLFKVYGRVIAWNDCITDPRAKSVLFHRERERGVGARPGKEIALPLSRHVTVHPLRSNLTIEVSIWRQSTTDSQDELIASDKKQFANRFAGGEEWIIQDKSCDIKVNVTWFPQEELVRKEPCFYF